MCENLLRSVLIGNLKSDVLIQWLRNNKLQEDAYNEIYPYNCSQGEFILFFLNYLHEETSGILQSFSTQMTPHKIKTPRRVEHFSSKSAHQNDSKKSNSRRSALFPENQNKSQNSSFLGVSALENESRHTNISHQSTSTPKHKSRSSFDRSFPLDNESSFKNSSVHMSPISPIYSKTRSSTDIRNKSMNSTTSSRLESSNFCLGDFIIKKSSVNKQKRNKFTNSIYTDDDIFEKSTDKSIIENWRDKSVENSFTSPKINCLTSVNSKTINVSRRINPTSLTILSKHDPINSNRIIAHDNKNSFSFQKISEIDSSIENSRDILKEERLKFLTRSKLSESNISEIVNARRNRIPSICIQQPSLEFVTNKLQLDTLAQIYSLLIDLNLVLNTLSELHFLITLILIQVDTYDYKSNNEEIEELRTTLKQSLIILKDDSVVNTEDLFKNIHNCVYFAANVLSKQYHLLSALDRTSMKLLQENLRLNHFAPGLTKQLLIYHRRKAEKKTEIYPTRGGENVSFISDTDNRENFPNDSSFHTFRKQRDLFYELLRIWERNHLQSDWNFTNALTYKIRNLIFMHPDPVNSMHLARLFKNQLLAECSQISDATPLPSCLNGLGNIDAEKLSRLSNRIVSKKSTGGPSPEPSFPGKQDFYKEFIIVCESPKFHRHLIDCLAAEILQLNDTTLWPVHVDETNAVIDPLIRTLYLNSIKSLKVLAKFLGLLDSFPYKSECIPNHQILTTQISVRKHFTPSVNIIHTFNEALQTGKLSLTIPWLTDYLAMLDHITLRLPYFSQFIGILFEIHYNSQQYFKYTINLEHILMIKLSLGWLFERPNFPLESYQNWISKKYELNSVNELIPKAKTNGVLNGSDNLSIDCLDFIDETVLFTCCPYLNEIKNILSSDPNSNFNKSGSVKYIRPISTVGENSDISKKRLQKQLQEAFFHNQPASTRKTIDLVSERVTSACVKSICNNFVPEAKIKYLEKFRNHLEHISTLDSTEIREQISKCCMKHAKHLSDVCFEELKLLSKDEITKSTKLRCENSLKSLLADDVHLIARATCVSITIEQSTEKIEQWFSSHVNPGIFLKEFVSEMENIKHNAGQHSKKITYKLPSKGRKNIDHSSDAPSPVNFLINIREQMYKIHEKPEEVNLNDFNKIIEDSSITCQKRCDLNQVAQFTSCRLFFDMFIMLASKRPDIASDATFIENLLTYWDKYLHKYEKKNFFDRVFCPRNVGMFESSTDSQTTWLACEKLLMELFRKELLKPEQFEKQTIAMFRYEWESNTIKYFTKCLQNVIDDYVTRNGIQENFTLILSWIAGFCNDEEFF